MEMVAEAVASGTVVEPFYFGRKLDGMMSFRVGLELFLPAAGAGFRTLRIPTVGKE